MWNSPSLRVGTKKERRKFWRFRSHYGGSINRDGPSRTGDVKKEEQEKGKESVK